MIFWVYAIVLAIFSLSSLSCSRQFELGKLTVNDNQVAVLFKNQAVKPKIHYYRVGPKRVLRAIEIGDTTLPVTLLLHGSPASWSAFMPFFYDSSLYNHTHLVAIDRPGYGYSDFGVFDPSVKGQARRITPLMKLLSKRSGGKPMTVVGSSYGGSVAAKLAMDNQDLIGGICFVSSSLAPGQETIYRVSYLMNTAVIYPWLPRILQMPNDEKLAHRRSLREIEDGWSKIKSKVIMLHGDADGLVWFSNTTYAKKKLINADLTVVPFHGRGHDIIWDSPDTVATYVKQLLPKANATAIH